MCSRGRGEAAVDSLLGSLGHWPRELLGVHWLEPPCTLYEDIFGMLSVSLGVQQHQIGWHVSCREQNEIVDYRVG